MFIEKAIFLAYGVTLTSELIAILLLQKPKEIFRWITGVILINSLTHPIAIYFLHIQHAPYILVEVGVMIVELVWYKIAFRLSWGRALLISVTANLTSIIMGFVIRALLGV